MSKVEQMLLLAFLSTLMIIASTGCRKERSDPPAASKAEVVAPLVMLDGLDASSCAGCHASIVSEFDLSMHARSHHDRDPIYAGVRRMRMAREGNEVARACERCHTPALQGPSAAKAAGLGVVCGVCHQSLVGAPAGVFLGAHDLAPGLSPMHGTGKASPRIADGSSLCLVCHASLESPKGLPMCTTGIEHQGTSKEASCVSCHMPAREGAPTLGSTRTEHASHAFLGPHNAWLTDDSSFLASAIELTASFDEDALDVRIANRSGHDFPTGFPGRVVTLRCEGRDAKDQVIWSCDEHAMGKVYVDAEGKPTLAPWAERIESDTRIPAASEKLHRMQPPREVVRVEITVEMRLVPASLAHKLGLADAAEGQARVITTVSASR
jgi:hypothetical protein